MAGDNTSILELLVRSAIPDSFGVFETNLRDLRGTPDVVFRKQKVVVFVHGCYWHRHMGCSLSTTPHKDFVRWMRTFNTTVRRDTAALNELRAQGWKCLVFWECEVNSRLDVLILQLGEALGVSSV